MKILILFVLITSILQGQIQQKIDSAGIKFSGDTNWFNGHDINSLAIKNPNYIIYKIIEFRSSRGELIYWVDTNKIFHLNQDAIDKLIHQNNLLIQDNKELKRKIKLYKDIFNAMKKMKKEKK